MLQHLSLMWETPYLFCPLNFSSLFATKISGFNVKWMLHQIDHEIFLAYDLALIRNGTAMFLTPPEPPKSTRPRRGASILPCCPCHCWTFGGGGGCYRWFRFMWFTWNFWKLSRSVQGKRRKCTPPSLFSKLLLIMLQSLEQTRMKSLLKNLISDP